RILALQAFVSGEVNQQDAVGRGDADRHNRAHHRRDADGRLRYKQHPDDAGERAGQSHHDNERIEPGLKIDGYQQVDEDGGERQSNAQARKRGPHRFDLTAHVEGRAPWQFRWHFGQDLVHFARDPGEVAVLHAGKDVQSRLYVVVADHARRYVAVDGRQITHQLWQLRLWRRGRCA